MNAYFDSHDPLNLHDPLMSAPRPPRPLAPSIALAPGNGEVRLPHLQRDGAVRRGASAGRPGRAGSGQDVSWPLPSSPMSVREARHLTGGQLADWGITEVGELAELLVSELVTNAYRYGAGPIRLTLLSRRDKVRFEIHDAASTPPRLREVHEDDEGGRGLHLVEQLSSRWGSALTASGKIVWFELPVSRPRRTADFRR